MACAQHCRDKRHSQRTVQITPAVPTPSASGPSASTSVTAASTATTTYECKPCCLVFTNKALYDEHIQNRHPAQPQEMYKCTPCGINFSSAEALSIHYRNFPVHPKCPVCKAAFVDDKQLSLHQTAHVPRTFRCAPCGRDILVSERSKHYQESPSHPSCFVCEEGFRDDSELNDHLSSAHLQTRCSLCKRQLRSTEELENHYLISPMHPHCASCEVGFVDDVACSKHMELAHPHPPPKVASPSPAPAITSISISVPPSSVGTQQSTQSSPLVQRPLMSGAMPTVELVAENERSDLDDDTYETVEASSHVQRAVSEPTLPTVSSIGDSVQGTQAYAFRSPTTTEQSFDDMVRMSSAFKHPDSESTISLQSVSTAPSRPPALSPDPPFPQPNFALPHPSATDPVGNRPSSILSQRASDISASLRRRPSVSSFSEHTPHYQQASRTPSRAMETPSARSQVQSTVISRPSTPRIPIRTNGSRSLSRVSTLSTGRPPAASVSQKPSMTVVEPAPPSDSERTAEGPSSTPKLKATAVRPQGRAGTISWHCRSCMQDTCVAPTATACGHVFCAECIIRELSQTGACPACGKLILLRLHVEAD
ncbi:hypothetical protein BD413DRAFT_468071 [Trametes elegans]|nr:hypothetical protein BD413DRAFT_468071 [Trametes elegans]